MESVSPEMRVAIIAELDRIEKEEAIRILFAIESGSRAWGFHSRDSDYDVRFVYARPLSWHLRVDDRRDVIERPISGDLDISGWELGKALGLAIRSNAVLSEWLQSPITYVEHAASRLALADFCRSVLTRRPVTWHYLSLAERQRNGLRLPDGQIKLKRYLYTLRPVLALRWMRLHGAAMPPMNLWGLLDASDVPPDVRAYVQKLVSIKLESGEMGTAQATHPATDALIEHELGAARDWLQAAKTDQKPDAWAAANQLNYTLSTQVPE